MSFITLREHNYSKCLFASLLVWSSCYKVFLYKNNYCSAKQTLANINHQKLALLYKKHTTMGWSFFTVLYIGVGGMVLVFGWVSRYCTWVFYFKDYNTAIQISVKRKKLAFLVVSTTKKNRKWLFSGKLIKLIASFTSIR